MDNHARDGDLQKEYPHIWRRLVSGEHDPMTALRIALFSEVFLPKVDGIVNTLCRLLDHLHLRGHASLLIAPEGGPDSYASTPIIGVEASSFPLYPELRLVSPWIGFAGWSRLNQILDDFKPDLVHVINPVALGLAGIGYVQRARRERQTPIPLAASYHTDIPGFAERWGLGFISPALWGLVRAVHNQADLNLAPSSITQRELIQRGLQHVKVWSRGVDAQLYSPARRSVEWRERLSNGHPEKPLLLSVGRLSAEKRIDWLEMALTAHPNTQLAIIGDGPQRAELQSRFARYADRVCFTGFLQGEDLAHSYASADIFVFTGANETFGNVVLEAMASGLPVVAPDSGGVLDVVKHNRNGLLYHAEKVEEMAAQVGRLLNQPELAARLSAAAHREANARSWSQSLDHLINEYSTLIRQSEQSNFSGRKKRNELFSSFYPFQPPS